MALCESRRKIHFPPTCLDSASPVTHLHRSSPPGWSAPERLQQRALWKPPIPVLAPSEGFLLPALNGKPPEKSENHQKTPMMNDGRPNNHKYLKCSFFLFICKWLPFFLCIRFLEDTPRFCTYMNQPFWLSTQSLVLILSGRFLFLFSCNIVLCIVHWPAKSAVPLDKAALLSRHRHELWLWLGRSENLWKVPPGQLPGSRFCRLQPVPSDPMSGMDQSSGN